MEDDYDSDFRYDGPPLTALSGLDRGRRVFYVGTFSKSVGAGLRLGFAVVPQIFSEDARMLKAQISNGQSWLEQCALAEFVSDGHFDRHVRKLRQLYKSSSRLRSYPRAAQEVSSSRSSTGQDSGLHLVWRLPEGFPPARKIQVTARKQGIGVYALSSGAAYHFDPEARDDMLVFGYSSLTEAQIESAVRKLKAISEDAG